MTPLSRISVILRNMWSLSTTTLSSGISKSGFVLQPGSLCQLGSSCISGVEKMSLACRGHSYKKIKLNQFPLFCIIALMTYMQAHEMNISMTYLSSSLLVHQMQEFLDMAAFMPLQRRRNCRNSINHLSR